MNKYIIGMAKSYNDKKGSQRIGLQSDFMKLVSAMENNKSIIHGFFLVYNEPIGSLVSKWLEKSQIDNSRMSIIIADGSDEIDWDKFHKEKSDQRTGNQPNSDKSLAVAKYCGPAFEKLLKKRIEDQYDVREVPNMDSKYEPKWDYVGRFV